MTFLYLILDSLWIHHFAGLTIITSDYCCCSFRSSFQEKNPNLCHILNKHHGAFKKVTKQRNIHHLKDTNDSLQKIDEIVYTNLQRGPKHKQARFTLRRTGLLLSFEKFEFGFKDQSRVFSQPMYIHQVNKQVWKSHVFAKKFPFAR